MRLTDFCVPTAHASLLLTPSQSLLPCRCNSSPHGWQEIMLGWHTTEYLPCSFSHPSLGHPLRRLRPKVTVLPWAMDGLRSSTVIERHVLRISTPRTTSFLISLTIQLTTFLHSNVFGRLNSAVLYHRIDRYYVVVAFWNFTSGGATSLGLVSQLSSWSLVISMMVRGSWLDNDEVILVKTNY